MKAGETANLIHLEGDADHPTNRATLYPKGAALERYRQEPHPLDAARFRAAGATKFQDIGWADALDKIAHAMKDDRDANLVQVNAAGVTVNRGTKAGFPAASATTNETAWLTCKAVQSLGIVGFDNQARV